MPKNIKSLKPSATSRTKQGYINPGSCKKLFPGLSGTPIIYRSSYEKRFIYWCESDNRVKFWGSECMAIPYMSVTDQKQHSYYPDFVVEMTNGEKWIIEIKPKSQCVRPVNPNGWLWNEYTKNIAKWAEAKRFCKSRGYKFKVLTEETIYKL